ncbi:unnamed protein product [Cylicostephanus goldi]|uniref:Uncharacterized protein n=1 Tax=Cylicostephanus goldi TaxID=71465 RepID=A0A3P6QUH2_CYLGO|nr:unnamed protein product [Cylicostephanus goldi]
MISVLPACLALYTTKDDVIELTSSNFQNRVINSDEVWINGHKLPVTVSEVAGSETVWRAPETRYDQQRQQPR